MALFKNVNDIFYHAGVKQQTSPANGGRMKFQARVVSYVNKVNLKFAVAQPVLAAQLAKFVAAIL
ncbi:hypothetical protein COO59_06880 [Mixta theicola]|uniref:Uncharacterized protein n=1 Tax=Mixta theicola TaxID=1458355 RepID=A0A2K1QB19_9GAMM|nr:hypothetical protein COO59_06880 [Mixta theicola]